MTPRLPLLLAFLVPLAACGGGEKTAERTPTPTASATPTATPSASAQPAPEAGTKQAREVITGWSDALRRSDVERAAAFFTVPLVISQGQAARLSSRAAVRGFNDSLPCGSKVTGVTRREDYFVASFELTERPGRRCDGPGNTARVAFKLRGNRIREWRQLIERAPEESLPPDAEAS